MNEKLKKEILENEDLLDLLLAVHFNNKTFEAGQENEHFNIKEYDKGNFNEPFRDASFFDIDYNIGIFNKWKNSNALDRLNEAIENNKEEATEENLKEAKKKYEAIAEVERGLYKEELDFVKKNLNKTFLNKAYFVFYGAGYRGTYVIFYSLARLFYTINKYKDEPIAEKLRDFLKCIINAKEVNLTNLGVDFEADDFSAFSNYVELGITFSEIILNRSKGSFFAESTYKDFVKNYRDDKGNILEDIGLNEKETKEVVAEYLLEVKNFLRIERLFNKSYNLIQWTIEEELAKKDLNLTNAFNNKDEDEITNIAINKMEELQALEIENKERTKTFKNEAVLKLISLFAIDDKTKELVADFIEPKKSKEEIRRKSYLSFNDLEPVGKEWAKVNVSEYNTAIMNLHKGIATYNENNIEAKQRNLNTINYKIEKLEEEDTLTDKQLEDLANLEQEREIAEEDLEETKKHLEELDKKIEEEEKELKKLAKDLIALNDKSLTRKETLLETRKLKRKIKDLKTSIEIHKKAKNSRGLYLQLAQDEGQTFITAKEDFNGGNIVMYLDTKTDIEKHFTREATKFLRFMQGKAYYLPFDKFIKEDKPFILDLNEYVEETGRKPTAIKSVRGQLENALDLLSQEYFRVNGTSKKYNLSISGKIELIGDYFYIEPLEEVNGIVNETNKTTFAIYLGSTYKKILLNEAVMQWASIPRLLNRITDKEIKQKGYEKAKLEVVQELGYYLYETLRKNLNKEGYYRRTFKLKTIVEQLIKSGALATNKTNTYNRRVIEPLEDAFNYLQEELKLITYSTKAFSIYAGDPELNEKGLAGSSEAVIKKAFENANITITFKVYDKESYDKIAKKNLKGIEKAKKIKDTKENEAKKQLELELLEDATFLEK